MLVALSRPRGKACEVVERLMVWLEYDMAVAVIDHRALGIRSLHAVAQRLVPSPGIPCPRYALGRERVTNGLKGLRGRGMLGGIRQAWISIGCGGNTARLIW